jgi:hypothetical protein
MTARDDALRTAVLKTLADDIGDAITTGKGGLLEYMQAEGIEKLAARLPDGTRVASLPVAGGEPSPRITDVAAFEAWVKANHPGETEVIIRDSYKKAVLADAKKAGRAVDRTSGDVIPGITFEATTAYVKVDFAAGDPDGRELIRRAWRDGVIELPAMVELPGGSGNGATDAT